MVQVTFEELTFYKDWFTKYVNSFSSDDEVLQKNIDILDLSKGIYLLKLKDCKRITF